MRHLSSIFTFNTSPLLMMLLFHLLCSLLRMLPRYDGLLTAWVEVFIIYYIFFSVSISLLFISLPSLFESLFLCSFSFLAQKSYHSLIDFLSHCLKAPQCRMWSFVTDLWKQKPYEAQMANYEMVFWEENNDLLLYQIGNE